MYRVDSSRSRLLMRCAAFSLALPLAATTSEAAVIGGLAPSRTSCQSSFVEGSNYTQARAILAAEGHSFRPGVATIDPNALAGLDIFVLSLPDPPLSSDEICALDSHVRRGGAVLEINNRNYPSILGVQPRVQVSSTGTAFFRNGSDGDVAFLSTGVVPPIRFGAAGAFVAPPGSLDFLQTTGIAEPLAVLFAPDEEQAGRAIVIGDEEVFNGPSPSCGGSSHLGSPSNQRFLRNVFSWLSLPDPPAPQRPADTDGDGYDDLCDPTPFDGVDGICPCASAWRNHGEYVSCVAHATGDLVKAGAISGATKGSLVAASAQSDCGRD